MFVHRNHKRIDIGCGAELFLCDVRVPPSHRDNSISQVALILVCNQMESDSI